MNLYQSGVKTECGERKKLLMILNVQAHQSSMVEVVLWLRLAWLLLKQAH